jgi:UDP-N-acetylmuramoyl-L-alanyl-D-glutamate--2,6-diaminopimelate ligase
MAESAANLSDFVIITSDNARTEEKEAIIADILVGLKGKNTPHAVIVDRTQAIQYALHMAQPGDVILLAGKGHEEYEIDKTGKHSYSERNIVLAHVNGKVKA